MYTPILVTPPSELISLDLAKEWLRINGDDEDAVVRMLINAAVGYLDGYSGILGRALVLQTWRATWDRFCTTMRLPLPAATGDDESIVVKWRNSDGQISTVDSDNYTLERDALGSFIRFSSGYAFPYPLATSSAIMIDFAAGYGDASKVPGVIKVALQIIVAAWYDDRSQTGRLPAGVADILEPVTLRRI